MPPIHAARTTMIMDSLPMDFIPREFTWIFYIFFFRIDFGIDFFVIFVNATGTVTIP